MSRIDEALKALERERLAVGGTTAPEVVAPVLRRARLEHYPGEGPRAAAPPPPPPDADRDGQPSARKYREDQVQLIAPRAVEGRGHVEGNGKLVGQGTPAVQV